MMDWIMSAIKSAVLKYKCFPLQVEIVSYGHSDPDVQTLLKELKDHLAR